MYYKLQYCPNGALLYYSMYRPKDVHVVCVLIPQYQDVFVHASWYWGGSIDDTVLI